MPVYSPDRVSRLRLVLAIVVAIAVLVADPGGVHPGLAARTAAPASSRWSWPGCCSGPRGYALKVLGDAGRPAKIATIVTGVLCLLSGLGLAGTWLAFLLPLIGLGLLFLALIPDDPEGAPVTRILVVQPEVDDPPHLFGAWLEEAGCTLEVCHPYAGDAVPDRSTGTPGCWSWAVRWAPTTTRSWSGSARSRS